MTHAGGTGADLEPATIDRLRAHAATIVAAGSVPKRARAELVEELVGHLVAGTLVGIGAGLAETDAAEAAVAAFGGVDELAADLSSAFHSRLWMSTIGVLLPSIASRDDRPAVIGWLRFALAAGMVLMVVGIAIAAWTATPGHALVTIAFLTFGLGGLVLAFQALGRGQRWALWYGVAFAAELVAFGAVSVVAPQVPGSLTIPLGAFLGAGILLGVYAGWERLQAFVAGSLPVGRSLQVLLGASLVGPMLVGPVVAAVPDPTQASADDLRLLVSVGCDRGDLDEPGFPTRPDVQQVTIVMDVTWRRGDLLPNGLGGLFSPHFGDTAGFRLESTAMDGPLPDWILVPRDPAVVDVDSGEAAGWFGATSPSVALIPDTIGSFTVGIDRAAIHAGRTLRAEWLLAPSADVGAPWPTVEVAYAHLDRFLLVATARCGETAEGVQVPLPAPHSLGEPGHSSDDFLP